MFYRILRRLYASTIRPLVRQDVHWVLLNEYRTFGPKESLHLAPTAMAQNATFNTMSGSIWVGDHSFFGHNVTLITGTHDYTKFDGERQAAYPHAGRNIVVGQGVWIGTNAVIVGPCRIGDHAVVAAGAVVIHDVPPLAIVAGVPSRVVKMIEGRPPSHSPQIDVAESFSAPPGRN